MIIGMHHVPFSIDIGVSQHLLSTITLPLSINGFPLIVIGPIGEEIFCRGVIYGYLRSKLPLAFAIVIQSLIFTLLHFAFVFPNGIYQLPPAEPVV